MKAKKSSNKSINPFARGVCYVLMGALIVCTAHFGSKNKFTKESTTPIMQAISENNFAVSVDQLSELYIVAELANNVSLASSSYLNMDYISAVTQYSINQTAASAKIEKVSIVDTSSLAKGVIEYEVAAGESMESIASAFGLSTDQIRWSNGKKTTTLDAGETLYLPAVPGIVYTIKEGETVASIASKYGSSEAAIEEQNNLAGRAAVPGLRIVLPGGTLPETERPEYVAPKPVVTTYYRPVNLTYTGNNPMPWGWCTWYAWQWRHDHMPSNYWLPSGLGNARYWDNQLSGSFRVDRSPEYGAVFVSEGGYYGHVGIVESVNGDGTITISDMNGLAGWGRVGWRTVGASEWGSWTYVHERY